MIIKTKRLILRPWNEKDIADTVEGLNNYEVSKWLALVPYPYTEADARDWITKGHQSESYSWAIDLHGKAIGGIGIKVTGDTAEGGIWISQRYHGHGYGQEAWAARDQFAFNHLKVKAITSGYFVGNIASALLHERAGYKLWKTDEMYNKAQGKVLPHQRVILTQEDWAKR